MNILMSQKQHVEVLRKGCVKCAADMTQCAAHDAHCFAVLVRNTQQIAECPIGGVGGLKESTRSVHTIHLPTP